MNGRESTMRTARGHGQHSAARRSTHARKYTISHFAELDGHNFFPGERSLRTFAPELRRWLLFTIEKLPALPI
ncbi:MAG: hypothetical protein ACKVP5_01290 [Aestuariivirga sp.]